jgi:hypothetical protein
MRIFILRPHLLYARTYSTPALTLRPHLLYASTYSTLALTLRPYLICARSYYPPSLIHILPVLHSTAISNELSKLLMHPLRASLRPCPDPSSLLPDCRRAFSFFRRTTIVLVYLSTALRDQDDHHSHFPCALAQNPRTLLLGFRRSWRKKFSRYSC